MKALGPVLVLAAAMALAACSAGSSPAGPTHEAASGTGVGLLLDEPALSLQSVACPDGDRCFAVGSGASPAWVQVAADQNWSRAKGPSSAADLFDVSCAGPHECLAVGSNRSFTDPSPVAWRSTDGGVSWVATKAPRDLGTAQRVACTKAGCVVVGIDAAGTWTARSKDLGRSWSSGASLPEAFTAVGGVSCSASQCVAVGIGPGPSAAPVGLVAESANRGDSWKLVTTPSDALGPLYDVACLNDKWCHAVGAGAGAVVVRATGSIDGDWHVVGAKVGATDLNAGYGVWCGDDPACITGGTVMTGTPAAPIGALAVPSRSGRSLVEISYPPASVVAVACASTHRCVAVGGRTVVSFLP